MRPIFGISVVARAAEAPPVGAVGGMSAPLRRRER
jgi:hypothetical protein